jgi:hypothetical protein
MKDFSMDDIHKLLNKIGTVSIRYSDFTKQYYVRMPEFSYIYNYRWQSAIDILEHKDSPEEAVKAFFYEIIDCDEIVTRVNPRDRYETVKNMKVYQFIDNDFVEKTDIKEQDKMYNYFEGKLR